MKRLSQAGELDIDRIFDILREPKANQIDKISFRTTEIRKYFPKSYTASRIHEHIIKLLEADFRKRQRENTR
jgi:ParB family chromosome partitioning protein